MSLLEYITVCLNFTAKRRTCLIFTVSILGFRFNKRIPFVTTEKQMYGTIVVFGTM